MNKEKITSLLARQPKGHALLQEFHADSEIFARDIERIHLRRWFCVGHESRIPNGGDWFTFDFAEESLIVVRGQDERVRALVNVCRHRGSRVCYEAEGSSKMLACPYHAWVYDLDGRLHSARKMGPSFDTSEHGLPQVHLRILEGLIFVCFAEEPPGLDEVEQTLAASLGHYGWKSARIAHREVYSVDANWKLTTENYLECYHCAPAHPEFARHHASEKPPEEVATLRAEAAERARAQGIEIPERFNWPAGSAPNQEGVSCSHDATYPGSVTGSEDGLSVAPLMGDFKEYDGGFTYLEVGVASFFLAYPDHGMMYLFIPRAPQKTDMEILWLVGGDTQEGVDYDLERLKFMWHATSIEDKRIIDQNQKGVNSRYYKPGPYGPMEDQARCFAEWYLEQIAPHASEDG